MVTTKELFNKKLKRTRNKYLGKHNLKKKITPFLSNCSDYLDFGCGFGIFAYLIAKDNPSINVQGYDLDNKKISYAKDILNLKNLKLSCTFPEKKNSFDLITLFYVLHELKDPKLQLERLTKQLNPGGHIMIYDFRKVLRKDFREWYEKKNLIREYKRSFQEEYLIHNKFTLKSINVLMSSLGIKKIECLPAGNLWFWYIGKKDAT